MCGIAGFVDFENSRRTEELYVIVSRMTDALKLRGPDDSGNWIDANIGIALGHRRLSILDLSPEGHQPMISASGRYVMVFNGEIYNHKQIREELEEVSARQWRGHSDTEIMLAAITEWGLPEAVRRFVGMFAFALWDREERILHLVRDRLGEKPIYYGWMGNVFLFGSELKSLKPHPQWVAEIDRDVLALYMRYAYVPSPYSVYKNIYKLSPGVILSLKAGNRGSECKESLIGFTTYWSVRDAAEAGVKQPFRGSDAEAVISLDKLLRNAVSDQMVADVSLGAFLSGGVDSSTIVALMQAQSDRPVKTFTIGFNEAGYNEAEHAKLVAQHLGTDHTEVYVEPRDAMAVIPRLPALYDEPFGDSSQIPTFLVAQLARRHVTVSLSGDGGDELFGGYNRYFWGPDIWRYARFLPFSLRSAMGKGIRSLSPQAWDKLFNASAFLLPNKLRYGMPGDKIYKIANFLTAKNQRELYNKFVSCCDEPTSVVLGSKEILTDIKDPAMQPDLDGFIERMMYSDQISYLPDDILVKVDRAAMGVSLETRVPFLDHRVVEFAWQTPLDMKIRGGKGKWLLRQVLDQYVPRELIERPKTGFAVPIDSWLRGPLKDWAMSLLDEKRLIAEGFLNPGLIKTRWQEHLSGRMNRQYYLWNVLMFQAWLEEQRH